MGNSVNPYAEWLDVQADQPNHYELLGVDLFETDVELIRANYWERYDRVRQYQVGNYSDRAIAMLEELSEAFHCLTDRGAKRRYDAQLKARLAAPLTSTVAEFDPIRETIEAVAFGDDLAPVGNSIASVPRPAPAPSPATRVAAAIKSVSLSEVMRNLARAWFACRWGSIAR